MTDARPVILQASAIAIAGRAIAIVGAPGTGKSSLALALIDRGAELIGDDAVTLTRDGDTILAGPPPNIAGVIEVRGVGLLEMPTSPARPLALMLDLDGRGERLPERIPTRMVLGLAIPCLAFEPGSIAPAIRAELALARHGLSCG